MKWWVNGRSLKGHNKRLFKIIKNMNLIYLRELVARLEYDRQKDKEMVSVKRYNTRYASRLENDRNKETTTTEESESNNKENIMIEKMIEFIGNGEDLGREKRMEYEEARRLYFKLVMDK